MLDPLTTMLASYEREDRAARGGTMPVPMRRRESTTWRYEPYHSASNRGRILDNRGAVIAEQVSEGDGPIIAATPEILDALLDAYDATESIARAVLSAGRRPRSDG